MKVSTILLAMAGLYALMRNASGATMPRPPSVTGAGSVTEDNFNRWMDGTAIATAPQSVLDYAIQDAKDDPAWRQNHAPNRWGPLFFAYWRTWGEVSEDAPSNVLQAVNVAVTPYLLKIALGDAYAGKTWLSLTWTERHAFANHPWRG